MSALNPSTHPGNIAILKMLRSHFSIFSVVQRMYAVILHVCPNKGIFEGKHVGKNRPIRSSVVLFT